MGVEDAHRVHHLKYSLLDVVMAKRGSITLDFWQNSLCLTYTQV